MDHCIEHTVLLLRITPLPSSPPPCNYESCAAPRAGKDQRGRWALVDMSRDTPPQQISSMHPPVDNNCCVPTTKKVVVSLDPVWLLYSRSIRFTAEGYVAVGARNDTHTSGTRSYYCISVNAVDISQAAPQLHTSFITTPDAVRIMTNRTSGITLGIHFHE